MNPSHETMPYLPLRVGFRAIYEQHRERSGQPFRLLGLVDPRSYDSEECGAMYLIEFPSDGAWIEAWPEEIFMGTDEEPQA